MDRTRNVAHSSQNQSALNRQKQQNTVYDHRYHFHIAERPVQTVKHMDKRPKSVLCNSSGIIVAEMVYRCFICSNVFETALDCRTHFRCFHETNENMKQ